MMLVRLAAAAGAGMAAVLFAATVYAAPADDQNFIAALDRQGIPYSSPQNAIGIAREINKTSGIPAPHAGYFVGASITSYCPSHSNAFSG